VRAGHADHHRPPRWGEPPPGWLRRITRLIAGGSGPAPRGLGELSVGLRRGPLAQEYLSAERLADHRRAGTAASTAAERAIAAGDWWPADVWAHRALWHFEQAEMTLEATRQARRIGDLRAAAGDPLSARRYYAEAIDEARDIGAEHEQGLAAVGLGRALLELGDASAARRLAGAAVDLLDRSGAPDAERQAARSLLGTERAVGGAEEGV
jgi:tetratricopeptide (TPR) repeat protein